MKTVVFSETIAASDLKVSRNRHLIEYMKIRRDVPVGVPLDLSTPTGMSCIGTYGENCKSDNVSKYRVLFIYKLLSYYYGMKINVTENTVNS